MGCGGAGSLASLQRTDKARRLATCWALEHEVCQVHEVSRCRSRVLLVRALDPSPGPRLGWDETDAAVAGCKRK